MNTAIVIFLIAALFGISIFVLVGPHFRRHNTAMCQHFIDYEGDQPSRHLRLVK